jgi:hypothetical protein
MLLGMSVFAVIITYPLLNQAEDFSRAHQFYLIRAAIFITPFLLLELLSLLRLYFDNSDVVLESYLRGNLTIVVSMWAITAIFELPSHYLLLKEYGQTAFQTVVFANWIKLILWASKIYYLIKSVPFYFNQVTIVNYSSLS